MSLSPESLAAQESAADLLLRPIVFDEPANIPPPPGWNGLIPFAFWIVDALRPQMLVELGTHMGNSYLAFCQAVHRLGLPTRCYAVDTWQGDLHAGFYDEGVYEALTAYHDPLYGRFSRLVRSTFDDAVSYFCDGSIDLLHIDGLHTYEAIQHDFQTWRPKLSSRAVVLFHDTNVRERDFGVWRFWEEISREYPSFTLLHSNGLGILAVGETRTEAVRWLTSVASQSPELTNQIRTFFSRLGDTIVLAGEAARLDRELNDLRHRSTALDQTVQRLQEEKAATTRKLVALDQAVQALQAEKAETTRELADKNARIADLENLVAAGERKVAAFLSSTSWRATAPLRKIRRWAVALSRSWRFRLHEMALTPIVDIEPLDGGRFRSTGIDPQFALNTPRSRMPCGWALVSIEIKESSLPLRPVLYALGAPDGREVAEFRLPMKRGGVVESLIRLPDHVAALRFDPINQPAIFSLGTFRIYEVGKVQILLKALRRYPRAFIKGLPYLRKHGLLAAKNRVIKSLSPDTEMTYETWVALYDTITERDVTAIKRHIATLRVTPLISVVMPVYNTRPQYLRKAIDSMIGQIYPNWQLCIADDNSSNPEVRAILQDYARRDHRIKVVFRPQNGHISAASNSALASATGDFVALMDHDDELPAHALYMVAVELNAHPDTDIIYSDEDKIDADGRRYDPYFKTDWNQELFYSQNIVSHLGVYRASLMRQVGGFREGLEGSQDYDLALRIVALTTPERIRHIPHILYHWRIFSGGQTFSTDHLPIAVRAARQALSDYFADRDAAVEIALSKIPCYYRVRHALPDPLPRVSLIVPTRDRIELLRSCIDGLLRKTDYPNLEIILVDNESRQSDTLAYFRSLKAESRVRIIRVEGAFNFSALNNRAADIAKGDLIGFINNDIEVIAPDWLKEMVSQVVQAGVGAVGAKLYYGDDTIQHAGVVLGLGGVAGHPHRRFHRSAAGYFGRLQLVQNVSCVTAACLLMPKKIFVEVGGFDEVNLPVAFNDVDLCLKIREMGYSIVWTPYAELYHLESASRGPDLASKEIQRFNRECAHMERRWGAVLKEDPFYSPNLTLADETCGLAFPPRVTKPWRAPA